MAGRGRSPKRLKAAAYRYADGGGPMPRELVYLSYYDRFGAANVLGRPLSYGEIQRIVTAEGIVSAYRERKASESWAVWAQKNKQRARLLEQAMIAAEADDG